MVLLAAQAFALGLTVAWTTIPASAIFLEDYGSGLLPVTYVGAAAAGALSTVLLARAVRHRALADIALRLYALVTAVFVAAWLLVSRLGADWVSFALLVVLPIAVPVGFMFIVGQAGMLLNVRVMKALYPRVIAGFALGFTLGGLAGPPILSVLGSTEDLFVAAGGSSLLVMLLVWATRRRYPGELSVIDRSDDGVERVTLRDLMRNRFVVLIMGYQMLSAVESQWLDYLVYDRAGQRYSDSKELAAFISRFLAIAYGADIVILLLVAGLLLKRFGLRLGLTANPTVVLSVVAAVVIGGVAHGAGATLVFVLIVGARVSDLVLSDGTTRTSVSAAYQAIPRAERLAAQANVESLGVPLAIGLSGVGLMVLRATVGTTNGLVLPVMTSIVLAAWIITALIMYRGYRNNLLLNLRSRLLHPEELALEGATAIIAVDRLLASEDPRDMRLGLRALSSIAPDDLPERLERLAMHDRPVAFDLTLELLIRVDRNKAESVARHRVREHDPHVRSASLRTLGQIGEPADHSMIAEALEDESDDVVVAASAALAAMADHAARAAGNTAAYPAVAQRAIGGGVDSSIADLNVRVEALAVCPDASRRILAARILGEFRSLGHIDRQPFTTLLRDRDVEVRLAALDAVQLTDADPLTADVVVALENRGTAAAALGCLIRNRPLCLTLADQVLSGQVAASRSTLLQFVRACRAMGDSPAIEVLRRYVHHSDRDVGLACLRSLAHVVGDDHHATDATLGRSILVSDMEHAARLAAADRVLTGKSADVLRYAIGNEIDLLRERILASLALIYGRTDIDRVQLQLRQSDPADLALATEWLDVTLNGEDRSALALLEPRITNDERSRRLSRAFPTPTVSVSDTLRDIINDRTNTWRRPWLTACALLAAADAHDRTIEHPVGPGDFNDHDDIVQETLAGLQRRRSTM